MSSFEKTELNVIDSLIFTWLSYLEFEQLDIFERDEPVTIRDLFYSEYFDRLCEPTLDEENSLMLLSMVAASPRFRNVIIDNVYSDTDIEHSQQFAAVTYIINENTFFIAFRGTDKTFAGWKEDFELSLNETVPSQNLARIYLNMICKNFNGKIYVGGHSKGGNLAVFASAMCEKEISNNIVNVFSFDGPGFHHDDLISEEFINIRDRIIKVLPQSSIFGLIFEQECEYEVIKSHEIGINQHNPFSWEVEDGDFVYRDKLAPDAEYMRRKINNWINELSLEDRKRFTDGFFLIFENTGAVTLDDLFLDIPHHLPTIIHSIISLDRDMQKFLMHSIILLAQSRGISLPEKDKTSKLFSEFSMKFLRD